MEHPWESTKEFAGNIRDDVVDAVWRSTPQEISEDAGEILGDVLTGIATGGGGKAAAGGAKMAGNKLLALGKTGAKEFAEGLGSYGKLKVATVGGIPVKNTVKNMTKSPAKILMSNADDTGKSAANLTKGIASKTDDAVRITANSEKNIVSSTTKELVDNAVKGTPIVEASKRAGKKAKNEVADNVANKTEKKAIQEAAENKVVKGESGKGKGDGVHTSGAVNQTEVKNIENLRENQVQNTINNIIENSAKREIKLLKNINYDSKQIGKKWGKHKEDYPKMKDYNEYRNYAKELFEKPDKIIYDMEHKEYLYIKGKDLLRVKENGDFVSLYPGADTARVTNAIENGGIIWQQY